MEQELQNFYKFSKISRLVLDIAGKNQNRLKVMSHLYIFHINVV